METQFPSQPSFVPSTLGSLNNMLVFSTYAFRFRRLVSQPCFSPGGVCFSMCSQKVVNHSCFAFNRQFLTIVHVFHFPGASVRWQQPDIGETARGTHTCGNSALQIDLLCTGPRPSHPQLHFTSFRSGGLETVEKFKRPNTVAI